MKHSTLLLALSLSILLPATANAEWYRLSWVNPTERVGDTPYDHATEGSRTNIYDATTGDLYKALTPDILTYAENFPNGCYKMALTATDNDGRESSYSPLAEWCAKNSPKSFTNVVVERIPAPSQ